MAFDGEKCIELVRDKSTNEVNLIGAIESLMYFPTPAACDALFDIVIDEFYEKLIREEAAGTLGSVWIELGLDYKKIKLIPKQFHSELTGDFAAHDIDISNIGDNEC